ncbi:MAG: transposase [Ktedonobacterales bacterium]
MTLHPQAIGPVPEETARVARAACPKGNPYLAMRDLLGSLYEDQHFAALFPLQGQPAFAPWRLALVTIMQFAEGLSDRQAAEAVRARLDWKYALNLELVDPGFDFSILCEFRARLLTRGAEQLLFETMLEHFKARGLLKARGQQRTDSTHVLAAIRTLNRLECVGETMRHALESLAVVAPTWLLQHAHSEWKERYEHRIQEYRLPGSQTGARDPGRDHRRRWLRLAQRCRRRVVPRLAAGGSGLADPALGLDPAVLCPEWAGSLAHQRGASSSRCADPIPLRCASSLRPQADHDLDWVQGAPDARPVSSISLT